MVRSTPFRVVLVALLGITASLTLAGCGEGVQPTALPAPTPAATCTVNISGQNVTVTGPICGDGNGTVTQPAATPTPSTGAGDAKCNKEPQVFFENNVLAASAGIPTGQSAAAHINAVKNSLERAGFKVKSGAPLSGDEFALRNDDSFSETYDVCQGDFATMCTPIVLYQATCRPAVK